MRVRSDGQGWEQVHRCLQAWSEFPADRDPRPLVLLGPMVRAGPFPVDGRAKLAFVRGLVEAAPGVPAEVLQALRPRPQEAGPPVEPLLVTTATLGSAEFLTDRGQQQLPAWEVHARSVPEPIWVLDPETGRHAWRPHGLDDHELSWHGSRAELGGDERAITLSFTGIPRAYADYRNAEVLEAGTISASVSCTAARASSRVTATRPRPAARAAPARSRSRLTAPSCTDLGAVEDDEADGRGGGRSECGSKSVQVGEDRAYRGAEQLAHGQRRTGHQVTQAECDHGATVAADPFCRV